MIESLLLYLAGFKNNIIAECKIDRFHASIIGALILIVGIYATLAWTFFFQTVFEKWETALIAGSFMGCFIVSFDRSLIASMTTNEKISITAIIFRIFLALLLGIFLSQPMILLFFKTDINREAKLLITQRNLEHQQALDTLYNGIIHPFKVEKDNISSLLEQEKTLYNTAENDFKAEMDGSGGTGQYGYSTVAQQKEKIAQKHKDDYDNLKESLKTRDDKLSCIIDSIEREKRSKQTSFESNNTTNGSLIQTEALESLINKDHTHTLLKRYILLSIILTLIELSALIAKLLFNMPSYRRKLKLITEAEIRNSESNEKISLTSSDEFKDKLTLSISDMIEMFFNKTKNPNELKLDRMINFWKDNDKTTYKDLCQLFMDQLMIQGINIDMDGNNGSHTLFTKKSTEIINNIFGNFFVLILFIFASSYLFIKYCIPEGTTSDQITIISIIISIMGMLLTFNELYQREAIKQQQ